MVMKSLRVCLLGLILFAGAGVFADDLVTLSPFQLRVEGQNETVLDFINAHPFDAHIGSFCNAITSNIAYRPIFLNSEESSVPTSNVTSVVVGKIASVRLLFVSAANSNASIYAAWYEVKVAVLEHRKGDFPRMAFSFLFADCPGHTTFYTWPYLKGNVLLFWFADSVLINNCQVQNEPPYLAGTIKNWPQFYKEKKAEARWVTKNWDPSSPYDRAVNIHLENDERIVVLRVQPYGAIGSSILNYNEVHRIVISLKTRDVVEDSDWCWK